VQLQAIPAWRDVRSAFCCALAFAASVNASVIVQLRIVDGDAATYRTGTRATRGLTVLVTDEDGRPVDRAAVSFRLPEQGASGTFSTGLRTEVVNTGLNGHASVWGILWNKTPGTVEIKIAAVKEQARAGIVSTQYLSDTVVAKAGGEGVFTASHKGGHKWIWFAAIGGVAAGAGLAFGRSQGSSSPSSVAPPGLSVGAPSITIGHP
jgi:hypothetical protein